MVTDIERVIKQALDGRLLALKVTYFIFFTYTLTV